MPWLWSGQAREFRQRSREGLLSWSLVRSGRLLVTNQRLWIEDAPEKRSWLLKNLTQAEISYTSRSNSSQAQQMLQLSFSNLKKPIAFEVTQAVLQADVDGHSCQAILAASGLALRLQKTPALLGSQGG